MSYLLTGYYLTETTGYDISWTMPCCVLCLRMIGLAVDVHDGTKTSEELSKDQKDSALTEVPSILEVCSQSFFVGGYFVGPQFSMRKFQNYIQRNINEDLPPSRRFAFKRFGLGLAYLMGHLLGDRFVRFFKRLFLWRNNTFMPLFRLIVHNLELCPMWGSVK